MHLQQGSSILYAHHLCSSAERLPEFLQDLVQKQINWKEEQEQSYQKYLARKKHF